MLVGAAEILLLFFLGTDKGASYAFKLIEGSEQEYTIAGREEVTVGGVKIGTTKITTTQDDGNEKTDCEVFFMDDKRRPVKIDMGSEMFMELVIE